MTWTSADWLAQAMNQTRAGWLNYSISALYRWAQRAAGVSEIIVSATDHGANNGIGEDPTAQTGTLTPASLIAKAQEGRREREGQSQEGGD